MSRLMDPFRFVLITVAGCVNQRHIEIVACLRQENRVLRKQLGQQRLRLNDDQRRPLAAKAKPRAYSPSLCGRIMPSNARSGSRFTGSSITGCCSSREFQL